MGQYLSPLQLVRLLRSQSNIPRSKLPIVLSFLFKSAGMYPGLLAENLLSKKAIEKVEVDQPPLFVLGHHRSGTTYLHKILGADPQWGCIDTLDFVMPFAHPGVQNTLRPVMQGLIRLFKMKHPHFRDYTINLNDPLEEDMYMIAAGSRYSAFWAELLPQNADPFLDESVFYKTEAQREAWKQAYNYTLKKVYKRTGRKPLLLKNPPNTGRVKELLELYPDAKFVFIYRNPYQVYYSTSQLWQRTLEKRYMLQPITDELRDEIIFSYYTQLMGNYEAQRQLIPEGNLFEIRYEDLKKDAFTLITRLYRDLSLPGFDEAAPHIRALLNKEKKYRTYSYTFDHATQDRVYDHWKHFIEKWDYDRLPVAS